MLVNYSLADILRSEVKVWNGCRVVSSAQTQKDLQIVATVGKKMDVDSSFKNVGTVPRRWDYLLRVKNGSCTAVLLQETFGYTQLTI